MRDALARRPVPDALWDIAGPLIEEVRCAAAGGGTAPIDDRAVLVAIVFVLGNWCVSAIAAGIRDERADRASSVHRVGRRYERRGHLFAAFLYLAVAVPERSPTVIAPPAGRYAATSLRRMGGESNDMLTELISARIGQPYRKDIDGEQVH